jgi:hypothetical protein
VSCLRAISATRSSQVGTTASATGASEIRILQDAYPADLYNLGGDFKLPDAPQDLYVRGRIENADGDLYLTNKEGSINVTGELRARSVKLSAAGDFNLATDDWYHSGADPTQYLAFNTLFGHVTGKAFLSGKVVIELCCECVCNERNICLWAVGASLRNYSCGCSVKAFFLTEFGCFG